LHTCLFIADDKWQHRNFIEKYTDIQNL